MRTASKDTAYLFGILRPIASCSVESSARTIVISLFDRMIRLIYCFAYLIFHCCSSSVLTLMVSCVFDVGRLCDLFGYYSVALFYLFYLCDHSDVFSFRMNDSDLCSYGFDSDQYVSPALRLQILLVVLEH